MRSFADSCTSTCSARCIANWFDEWVKSAGSTSNDSGIGSPQMREVWPSCTGRSTSSMTRVFHAGNSQPLRRGCRQSRLSLESRSEAGIQHARPPGDDATYPSAATRERNFTDGLSRWKPSNRHLVENSTSSTPSERVSTSEDTCLLMNSASAGSTIRAT